MNRESRHPLLKKLAGKLHSILIPAAQVGGMILVLYLFANFLLLPMEYQRAKPERNIEVLLDTDSLRDLLMDNPELPLVILPFDRDGPARWMKCRVGEILEISDDGEKHSFFNRNELRDWLEEQGAPAEERMEQYDGQWERCIILEPN